MYKIVIIQQNFLKDLTFKINQYNKTIHPKLKLDVAVFYVSLLSSLPSKNREDEEERTNSGVALHSKILKSYHSRYKNYFNFLETYEFIKLLKNYSTDLRKCKRYEITNQYKCNSVIDYTITNKRLIDNVCKTDDRPSEKGLSKKQYCEKLRPHLIKFFDSNLIIDQVKAAEVAKTFLEAREITKYISMNVLINEFKHQEWHYSIKPDSDFRLHSSITRLDKVLRPYITYNGEKLGAIDIRSSQPYFFCSILKAIVEKNKALLKRIGSTKLLKKNHIDNLFNLEFDRRKVQYFIDLVINNDFYEFFAEVLEIKYNGEGQPYRIKFNNSSKGKWYDEPTSTIVYKDKRDLAKKVIMEILFSSSKSIVSEVIVFKETFPDVFKIMKYIKDECVELHKLLSNVEAYCLLDRVALEFNKEYPSIPIYSLHDSIITTQNHSSLLERYIDKSLKNITLLNVKLDIKIW